MQPATPFLQGGPGQDQSIARRSLDVEDLVNILKTNKGWLVGPTLAGLVIGVVVAFLWPDTYVSAAVVRVVPAQVPEKLVPSNVHMAMTHRVSAMAQTITSRASLTSIIESFGLYPRERNSMPMADIAEKMANAVKVGQVTSVAARRARAGSNSDMSAFQVSFFYENRFLAQKVAQELASRFITENTRQRSYQSSMTTQFLKEQWLAAKAEVDRYDQKLTELRQRNVGSTPDQMNGSVQRSSVLEARINTLNSNITRCENEKLVVQSDLRTLRDRLDAILNAKQENKVSSDPKLAALDDRIQKAEAELLRLLENYKPTHPDVIRFKSQIEVLRKGREEYIASKPQPDPSAPPQVQLSADQAKEVRDINARIATNETKLQMLDLQVSQNMKDIDAANSKLREIHAAMMQAPANTQEMASLMREYERAQKNYTELAQRMEQSQLATDLEARQQGETLEMLDQASLPDAPAEPQRLSIIMAGVIAGLGIGATLVFGKELKDKTLKTLKDVRAYTKLTILGSVPLLQNDQVVVRRRRLAWLAWSVSCLFSALIMGGAVYYYFANKV